MLTQAMFILTLLFTVIVVVELVGLSVLKVHLDIACTIHNYVQMLVRSYGIANLL